MGWWLGRWLTRLLLRPGSVLLLHGFPFIILRSLRMQRAPTQEIPVNGCVSRWEFTPESGEGETGGEDRRDGQGGMFTAI